MLLQRLVEYSRRLDLPPVLYSETPLRYVIDLAADGTPIGITDTADPSGKETRRGVRRLAPSVKRASGIKPLLLADNAEYTLGLARDEAKAERVGEAHSAYVELLEACRLATGSPEVAAVAQFMGRIPDLPLPADFDRAGLVTFRVNDTFVVDQLAVQAFWASENAPSNALQMQCLICGERRPVLERLQANIKGGLIPGGQTSGTAIISANAAAFESYGLTASLTAPTCSDCGERFTKALNHLLSEERSHIRFGDSVYVFWTREPVPDWDPFTLLDRADAEDVRVFMESVRSGTPGAMADPNRFYAVALSAAGGRAVVREWIDMTLPDARAALGHWFAAQAIIDANTGVRHSPVRRRESSRTSHPRRRARCCTPPSRARRCQLACSPPSSCGHARSGA
jgi:CRISPR-associated protein Csd1